MAVDKRNGLLAHKATPSRFVEQRTFINLPPHYADWAAQAGLPRAPQSVSTLGNTMPAVGRAHAQSGAEKLSHLTQTSLRITAPADGVKLLRDPSLPAKLNTIGLQVEVSLALQEVLWEVDGKPYQLAKYPYTVRWSLQPGEHTIRARSPLTAETSKTVRIRVE
jgi:hypothetical protein